MRLASMLLTFSLVVSIPSALADEGHHHPLTPQEIGSVSFATSCDASVAAEFNGAVALLHSFQYEQARAQFQAIGQHDPQCAMAYWGESMSQYHGLWGNGDLDRGRATVAKAAQISGSNPKTTQREKMYIGALEEIYKRDNSDPAAHALAFEQRMAVLQAAYPKDDEAAIFHALALAIMAPKTDKTFRNQRKCGEILEPIFVRLPHHPGIAHYLIHCYDNPALAEKGLPAARTFAKIAPSSAHANHMPSHIFTRVGSWQESIASNIRSAEIAANAEPTSKNGEARDQRLHAMDYLEYAYLQSGRTRDAERILHEMDALPPVAGLTLTGDYARCAIPARYFIENGNWKAASNLTTGAAVPWAQALTWTAVGIGGARDGNKDKAIAAEHKLASLRDQTNELKNTYWANQIEVQRREVAAWIAEGSGKPADALSAMRSAVDLEESMDKDAVTPGPVTPARELLAQLLSIRGQSGEALREYEAVLRTSPNRFNALYGAFLSAGELGDAAKAREYSHTLELVAAGSERPELAAATKRISQ